MNGSLQEKSGKYYAVFRINGKQKWVNLQIPTARGNKRKAELALKNVLAEYDENEQNIYNITFTKYLKMWLEQTKPLLKPSAWETYEKLINNKVIPYFKNKHYRLKDLKGMYFTEFFVYLKEHSGLGKKTITNVRCALSSALTYAVENDMIYDNVIKHSRLPRFEPKEYEPTIYTPEQIKQLLEYAEQTDSKAT